MAHHDPAPTTPRRRSAATRLDGDERQAAILHGARELLRSRPYSAVSVDAIARAAGLSRSAFYFYYPSKDAVVLAIFTEVVKDIAATGNPLSELAARPDDRDELWRRWITASYDALERDADLARIAVLLHDSDQEVGTLWRRVVELWASLTAEAIEGERERGAAPAGPPARELALALVFMNERILTGLFTGEQPALVREGLVDTLVEVWLRAVYAT